MRSARYFITGRVQGVFFRASTQTEAQRLGITGWVRNLADGRVEVLAQSEDPAALDRLADWLRHGPPNARVESVERQSVDVPPIPEFSVA